MLKDKAASFLKEKGFEIIKATPCKYSDLVEYRVVKNNRIVNIEVWYQGNYEATSGIEHLRFYPVVAHYMERTTTYKTLQGFANGFDKRFK